MKLRVRLLAILGLLLPAVAIVPAQALAVSGPRVYFGQSDATVASGGTVRLPLRLDAAGTAVNTVSVVVNFPDNELSFAGLDKTGSYFDTIIPSTPKAANGKVEFSVASLSAGPTSGDELIGTLVLSAKTSSGIAQVTLNGSAAANNGSTIGVTPGSAAIRLTAGSSTNDAVNISAITVTDVQVNRATVRWHTNVPASSSVDYGSTTQYGFTATTAGLVTDHVVPLAAVFAGAVSVHFTVTSIDGIGTTKTSTDQTFITKGYTIAVTVVDKSGKALTGAKVSVAGGKVYKANAKGIATIANVQPGNQKVVINGGKDQFIAVKALPAKTATSVQSFKLTANRNLSAAGYIALTILVVAALLVLAELLRQKAKRRSNLPKV